MSNPQMTKHNEEANSTQAATKTSRSGSELLVEALLKEGTELLFGYPGGAVLPLYDTFYDGKIKHILARHEQGAVHAAEGYARVSGITWRSCSYQRSRSNKRYYRYRRRI